MDDLITSNNYAKLFYRMMSCCLVSSVGSRQNENREAQAMCYHRDRYHLEILDFWIKVVTTKENQLLRQRLPRAPRRRKKSPGWVIRLFFEVFLTNWVLYDGSSVYRTYVKNSKVHLCYVERICLSFTCVQTKELCIPHMYINARKQASTHLTRCIYCTSWLMVKCMSWHRSRVQHACESSCALCPLRLSGITTFFSVIDLSLTLLCPPPPPTVLRHSEPSVSMHDHQIRGTGVPKKHSRAHECPGKALLTPVTLQLPLRATSQVPPPLFERKMKLSNSFPINHS